MLLSFNTATPPTFGGAFTPFGEKYAVYPSGYNGYFAGMLGIADAGGIGDAYQADARLLHQAQGRWVSPDPAGLGAVDMTHPQSWNRYAYVLNNPLSNTDPSGLASDGDNSANNGCPAGFVKGPNGDGCVPANVSPSTSWVIYGNCQGLANAFPGAYIPGCGAWFQVSVSAHSQGSGEVANLQVLQFPQLVENDPSGLTTSLRSLVTTRIFRWSRASADSSKTHLAI